MVSCNGFGGWLQGFEGKSEVVTCITAALYMVLFKLIFAQGCNWQTFFTYFMVKGMAVAIIGGLGLLLYPPWDFLLFFVYIKPKSILNNIIFLEVLRGSPGFACLHPSLDFPKGRMGGSTSPSTWSQISPSTCPWPGASLS